MYQVEEFKELTDGLYMNGKEKRLHDNFLASGLRYFMLIQRNRGYK